VVLTIKNGFIPPHTTIAHSRIRAASVASVTQDGGFAPDRSSRIFSVENIHSMLSFGGEVK
jgi:uncharacterized protein (DUF1786 family)